MPRYDIVKFSTLEIRLRRALTPLPGIYSAPKRYIQSKMTNIWLFFMLDFDYKYASRKMANEIDE